MTAIILWCAITLQFVGKPNLRPSDYQQAANTQAAQSANLQNDQAAATDTDHADKSMPAWYTSPEWWLVGVGILTLIGIYYQARETSSAARAAQAGAEAAKLSAEALIAQNRPWMLLAKETTIPASPPQDWKFDIILKNYGNTPAKIIWIDFKSFIGTSDASPPDTSIYDRPPYSHPIILPPQDTLQRQERLPEPWASNDVIAGNKSLWLCGYVIYSDTLERQGIPSYETAFCFVYKRGWGITKPRWERSGPREYNRAT